MPQKSGRKALKMRFIAHPNKGANDIEFGMTAEMVAQRMTGELDIGDIRATSKDHPTYSYPEVPVFFYFDEDGHLEGIEFCAGANALLGGINLLNLSVREAITALTQLDPMTVVDHDGATSHKLSLSIWCPHIGDEEDPEPVETLLLGRPGYFDE